MGIAMKACLLVLCVFAVAAYAEDDLFKPVDEEVVLLEEEAEPTQSQYYSPFMGMGMWNPWMMGMWNPWMMGMWNPWMMGMMPQQQPQQAANASFLEEEAQEEAEPSKMWDPFMMGMGMWNPMMMGMYNPMMMGMGMWNPWMMGMMY